MVGTSLWEAVHPSLDWANSLPCFRALFHLYLFSSHCTCAFKQRVGFPPSITQPRIFSEWARLPHGLQAPKAGTRASTSLPLLLTQSLAHSRCSEGPPWSQYFGNVEWIGLDSASFPQSMGWDHRWPTRWFGEDMNSMSNHSKKVTPVLFWPSWWHQRESLSSIYLKYLSTLSHYSF